LPYETTPLSFPHPPRLYAPAGNDARTTLMIKNIPNKYTQKMLLATIDEHFRGTYDFFYLPIDFKNKCGFVSASDPCDTAN